MADTFDQLIDIRVNAELIGLFSPAKGNNFIYTPEVGVWAQSNPIAPARPNGLVTWAIVGGRFFIFYESDRLMEYDPNTGELVTRTLILPVGVVIASIIGCSGVGNYLILHTPTSFMWSSLTNLLDFNNTPQGSGRITPIELKGSIVAVVPTAGGCLVASTENILMARFTNQSAIPFGFAEIKGSAGIVSGEQITYDSNNGVHYTWGASGLQAITASSAENVFGEVTDYIASRKWDTLNFNANPFHNGITSEVVASAHRIKMKFLSNRYLMISVGRYDEVPYKVVFVWDVLHQRWGKLRLDHKDLGVLPKSSNGLSYLELLNAGTDYTTLKNSGITYVDWLPIPETSELRSNYIFLHSNGECDKLVVGGGPGVLYLGRVQAVRNQGVTFQTAFAEGVTADEIVMKLAGSRNGTDQDVSLVPTLLVEAENYAKWAGRFSCTYFEAALFGTFDLNQVVIDVTTFPIRPSTVALEEDEEEG